MMYPYCIRNKRREQSFCYPQLKVDNLWLSCLQGERIDTQQYGKC